MNFTVRKLGHLTEYGVFGVLAFRAFRGERRGWSMRWAMAALASALLVASIDEWHQTLVPGRTGAITDVLLDVSAAAIAQFLIRHSELF
jgi:VanZ family protein